jgi:uncharacterized protein (DUF433 family)
MTMSAAEILQDQVAPNGRQAVPEVVSIDPQRLGGEPCFRGTRVPIRNLFDYLEGGDSLDEFLIGCPGVTREQALIKSRNSREDPPRS